MIIRNKGQAIVETDYWDTEQAEAGFAYLSWNAGAARVLLPDNQKGWLRDMRSAKEVIVSRGPWEEREGRDALELLWEDRSNEPFVLHLVAEQTDRLIPSEQQGGGFVVTVWTRGGQKGRWPGRYRVVDRIPYLEPWSAH